MNFRLWLEDIKRDGYILTIGYAGHDQVEIDPEDALRGGQISPYQYRLPRRLAKGPQRMQRVWGTRSSSYKKRYKDVKFDSLEDALKEFQDLIFQIRREGDTPQTNWTETTNDIVHLSLAHYRGNLLDRTDIAYWTRPMIGMGEIHFNPKFNYLKNQLVVPHMDSPRSSQLYHAWLKDKYNFENSPTEAGR